MKTLKKLGLVILALVAIILIAALFVSRDFKYEISTQINAPQEVVWENVNSLADLNAWGPWAEYDPAMKMSQSGVDGTVGAIWSWESDHERVGSGKQTITRIDAPNEIDLELKFYTPYESEAAEYIILKPNNNGTEVVWGFTSEMPYPFNLMQLFMDIDEAIRTDFNRGLSNLKSMSEHQASN